MRVCRTCGEHKPHDDFYKTRRGKSRDTVCKRCRIAAGKVRDTGRSRKGAGGRLHRVGQLAWYHYRDQVEAQEELCAICASGEKRLVLDHNHATGQQRGALCDNCNNRVLAIVENTPELIVEAHAYLSWWNEEQRMQAA